MSELKVPKFKGKNLESHIGDSGMSIVDPNNKDAYIKSDINILNIESREEVTNTLANI